MKTIFPREILEYTAEVHYFRFGKRGMHIYITILCSLMLAIGSLPFIKVDVYSSSAGIIKPNSERYPIVAIVDGRILESRMSDNQYVQKGDTLLIIDYDAVNGLLRQKRILKEVTEASIHDLNLLSAGKTLRSNLITAEYRSDLDHFKQEFHGYTLAFKKSANDFKRDSGLYERNVIARAELEKSLYELKVADKDRRESSQRKLYQWQSQLAEKHALLGELSMDLEELESKKTQHIIQAPANGYLLNLRAQNTGSFITPGTTIAEITPDAKLYAECFVSTKDIGLIHPELQVKFQIHAFNSYQWGLLDGKIATIGNDIIFRENTPFYKIRCLLAQDHLILKNGVIGQIKNGMTITAHFKLDERTVWDLLYDKTEDWIQPKKQLATH